MSVKIVILKSMEDVIADVTEMMAFNKIQLNNPYVVSLSKEGDKVGFYPYAPLCKDTSVTIPLDWVVTILEPRDEVKNSYVEKLNGKSEDPSAQE